MCTVINRILLIYLYNKYVYWTVICSIQCVIGTYLISLQLLTLLTSVLQHICVRENVVVGGFNNGLSPTLCHAIEMFSFEKMLLKMYPGVSNPSENAIPFDHNTHFNCQIVLKLCREHGTGTAVLCCKISKRFVKRAISIAKRDFARF